MKALALDARVILMDEPTGWLAASDVAKLHAHHPRAQGARRRHRLYQPRPRRDLCRLRHADDHARRRASSLESAVVEHRPAARSCKLMVGDEAGPRLRGGGAASSASRAAPARSAELPGTSASAACSRTSASTSTPARSSASPASSAPSAPSLFALSVRLGPLRQRHA